MRIEVDSVIRITDPPSDLLDWCERELTLANPEFAKKERMGFWTGNTPEKLELFTVRGSVLILPFGLIRQLKSMLDFKTAIGRFAPIQHIDYGAPLTLYDYQQRAVEETIAAGYGILQAPAGSGKTEMGVAMIKKFGRTALWLTTTHDLLKQAKDRAEKYMDKTLIGTIAAGKVKIGNGVTFATIQTMSKLDLTDYRDMWDVIIVDECHHVCSNANSATMFERVLNSLSARHKYGLSATVHRGDGLIKATYALLGDVVCTVPKEEVADKILPVGIIRVETDAEMTDDCIKADGKVDYTKLINTLCEDEERNRLIIHSLLQNRQYSCLVLSDRIMHLETLIEMLPEEMQSYAVMVTGKMTTKKAKAERDAAIEQMRTGAKRYLFATYSLAKEGLDIPRLERLFLATPQKDFAVVVQSVGRIARIFNGKADPVAYDFTDVNIGFMIGMARKRARIFQDNNCHFIEE